MWDDNIRKVDVILRKVTLTAEINMNPYLEVVNVTDLSLKQEVPFFLCFFFLHNNSNFFETPENVL